MFHSRKIGPVAALLALAGLLAAARPACAQYASAPSPSAMFSASPNASGANVSGYGFDTPHVGAYRGIGYATDGSGFGYGEPYRGLALGIPPAVGTGLAAPANRSPYDRPGTTRRAAYGGLLIKGGYYRTGPGRNWYYDYYNLIPYGSAVR